MRAFLRAPAAVVLASFLVAWPAQAQAPSEDPWLGPDKTLHFSVSAVISSSGYGVAAALEQDRPLRLVVGGALGVSAGVAKELADLAGLGHPSWRDLTWDLMGVATGLLLGFAIDVLLAELAGVGEPL